MEASWGKALEWAPLLCWFWTRTQPILQGHAEMSGTWVTSWAIAAGLSGQVCGEPRSLKSCLSAFYLQMQQNSSTKEHETPDGSVMGTTGPQMACLGHSQLALAGPLTLE